MFEYVFLGTSASAPSVHRGLSSHLVLYKEHRFLIDAGEGTQRQILRSGLGFRRIDKVFITHGHLDHILGLAGLISTFVRWETMDNLEIWAPPGARDRIHDLLYRVVLPGREGRYPISFIDIEPGTLMEDDHFTLDAFRVSHRGTDAFGFIFQEKPRRPFLPEKAEALGVPAGPERAALVRGETVALGDGRQVTPDMVLGDTTPGVKLVHVGDAGKTHDIVEHCLNADALVIEATYLEPDRDLAQRFGHLTARQSAELARIANVDQLYLTHVSRRYHEHDILREARSVFVRTTIARDFSTFKVTKQKPADES